MTRDEREETGMAPQLEFVCTLVVKLGPARELGACASGTRRIIPIVGGSASGPRLQGRVLGIGADWQTVDHHGVAQLDARYAIETDDGAIIEVQSRGMRHMAPEVARRFDRGEPVAPAEYYMRTAIRFDTGHADYAWMAKSLFIAIGGKAGATVTLAVHRVG